MTHIIERALIHFICSTFLTLSFFFALRYLVRQVGAAAVFISSRKTHLLTTAGLLVYAILIFREPLDTHFGFQVWYKSITDQISWLLGAGISVYGLYRFDRSEEL